MNCLILLCLASAVHGNFLFPHLHDTPEVAAAEAVHLGRATGGQYQPQRLLSDGYIPHDTPEVAAAKAAHLAAVARATAATGGQYQPQRLLSVGVPVVTPDGFIADTPEVAAAKAAHFAFKAQAAARDLGVDSSPEYLRAYTLPPNMRTAFIWTSSYTGPIAIPVITPQGFLADTPEVANAKAAHLQAHLASTQVSF